MALSRTGSIKIDEEEYTAIIKGKIRQDLQRYLGTGDVTIGNKDGEGFISIAVDEIEIPTWRFGFPSQEGVAQGEGEPGDDLGPVDEGDEPGKGAGQGHGRRKVVIDLTPEEFAHYFEEMLELPRIQPKGDRTVFEEREKYNTLSRKGPRSLLHLKRTFFEAVKRAIALGEFRPPDKTIIVPQNDDLWFTSFDVIKEPKNNAVIFFARDVSGSMGPAERKVVSYLCDLCEFWLAQNYDRLEKVYIIHDDQAARVSRDEFFTVNWGGGTTCSVALKKTHEIIDAEFPVSQWNIYVVYLSDGFNWSTDDEIFLNLLGEKIFPIVNQFNYAQIAMHRSWWPAYGKSGAQTFSAPGSLGQKILTRFPSVENLAYAEVKTGDFSSAVDAIKRFFKKGT